MATPDQIAAFSKQIYDAARKGTSDNPGLPETLSQLLVAQARHETGNFSSNIFKTGNNAFGYTYSGSKYQTGKGAIADNGQASAKYATVSDSAKEIVDWIYRRVKENKFPADLSMITTAEDYAALLKSAGYYGDTLSNYLAGLKRFFTSTVSNSATVVISLALLVYLVSRAVSK